MRGLTRRRFVETGGAALAAAYAIGGRRPAAAQQASVTLPGLSAPGEILVDRYGIPHIYAATQPDAFLLQGYNAARDRLWQIDLWRRRGLGRLSAALGQAYVEQDRAARLFLYRGDIAREWAAYGDDAEQIATAFAAGVNAFIDEIEAGRAKLPVEFETLGYRPEKWAPEDVVRIRSHGLVSNLSDQVARAFTLRDFGRKAERMRKKLEPKWRYEVPEGLDLDVIPDDVLDVYDLAIASVEFGEARASAARVKQGSNNWTISGRRTATGRPILANDPHRTQGVPSLRYLAHLNAPGLNVIGAGEPALPGISIGHNEKIAFGLTIFAIDQEDLYVYETRGDEYRYGDGFEAMTVIQEEIPVKDSAPETVSMKFTRHGPVIAQNDKHAFAVRSIWFEPGTSAYFASISYMRAGNWREFTDGLRRWGAPGENQVYADTDGHIGWKPCGFSPVRRNWDGLLPVPGDGRYEWDGFLDADRLPVSRDPDRGWIATANAENLPRGYPYRRRKIGFEWAAPFRLRRIQSALRRERNGTLADSRRLQNDHRSGQAARTVPLLSNLETDDRELKRAIRLLRRWDKRLDADSGAAALFEIWNALTLPTAVLRAAVGRKAADAIWPGDPVMIIEWLERGGRERERVLKASLREAVGIAEELLGRKWSRWAWGDLHVAQLDHPIAPAVDAALAKKLSVGPVPVGGGGETVGDTGYSTSAPPTDPDELRAWFQVASGASFRQVIDVGAWDRSLVINNPGQSGDPDSPHYRDLIGRWARGRAVPMLFSRARVEAATEQKISCSPGGTAR